MLPALRTSLLACLFFAPVALAQQPTTASQAPTKDSSYIDEHGTAHVTRVIPVPQDLSPEAQKSISASVPDEAPAESLEVRRKKTDEWQEKALAQWTQLCPNKIENTQMAGVPVRVVTPEDLNAGLKDKVLLNLHGGGFNSDSGSYAESIPIASYTGIKVVAVLYRLAPEHPYPAAIDDSISVYEELLKTYQPKNIVIYGTSAGAVLTAEVAVRLKQ